jgi:hypothetical protein
VEDRRFTVGGAELRAGVRIGGVLLALGLVIQTGAEFGGYAAADLLDALEEVADTWEQKRS